MKLFLIAASIVMYISSCQQKSKAELVSKVFADSPATVTVKAGLIDEASGISDSRLNNGFLWVEQDSGNPPELSLLSYDGTPSRKIYLKGAENRDWEDMALAKGPQTDVYYIYLADIGDNFLQYNDYTIYRFPEPLMTSDSITSFDKIKYTYPDGSNNAEAIFVDNVSRDIYIITKSNVTSNIFKLVYPQKTTGITEASLVGSLPFTGVVGAAISPDGSELIVKTYTTLSYWKRGAGESIETMLKRPSTSLGYQLEIQGEAVCFKNDHTGFYTLSEKTAMVRSVGLNFYKRN